MGIKALRRLQLGREATPGTAVAATTIWRGLGALEDGREVVFAEEDIGIIGGVDRAYIPKLYARLEMSEVPATFEQVLHILEAGVRDVGTGTADGSGSGRIYSYPLPTVHLHTVRTYTIEGGDDQQSERLTYGVVEAFELAGSGGEALTMSANWFGRSVEPTTFTSALSVPTVETILFGRGRLFIDDVGGTIGTTQISNTLLEMSLRVSTGWTAHWTADDSLAFTIVRMNRPEATLEMTFEHNGSAVGEKAAWRAGTPRQIRLQFEGSNLATPGPGFSRKTLRIDLAGVWERFGALEDADGNDIVRGTFRARYSPAAVQFVTITVVNELTSVP